MHLFTTVFLSFVAASVLVRLWLSQRQISHISAHYDAVPEAFADKISLQDHHRAADYSCTRLRFGRLTLGWETLWLLIWTMGGGINVIDQWWLGFEYPGMVTGIAVILSLTLLSAILGLPFSLYQTFVIEERFGFNKTTLKTWLLDLVKTAMLLLLLGAPLLAAILWLMNRAGDLWWIYAWLLWMGFSLVMIWAYPVFIAPLFNKFSPLQDSNLRTRIEDLLTRCGFHSQGVFVVDGSKRSSHGNAYFTGFGRNKRIVFYDTLLETLSEDEVEAVLAHELGHFKRNHIKKSLLLSSAMSLAGFALLAWLMRSDWFYSSLGVDTASTHAALILFMMVMPVFTYFIGPLFSALSRKHEFEADEFAHSNSNYKALISALVNLYRDNASTLTPDPIHSIFYDSHPPATIRINRLETIAGNGSSG
ncbi:MAG: M48 family metallopeptidase [Gammaproteobacteria bacterium]|nr:M48 family metallopeptidase [Gammaproteobacteria bacterium]MDH3449032.1 M48 family metallopeptidase [Gammaproteobacteria bacterium]